jgi:hypothetical protein
VKNFQYINTITITAERTPYAVCQMLNHLYDDIAMIYWELKKMHAHRCNPAVCHWFKENNGLYK